MRLPEVDRACGGSCCVWSCRECFAAGAPGHSHLADRIAYNGYAVDVHLVRRLRMLRITVAGLVIGIAAIAGPSTSPVTFNKDVLPILQKQCQNCHRPGEVAPMSFLSYKRRDPGRLPSNPRCSRTRCRPGSPIPPSVIFRMSES